ncbi:MAG: cbb3-type cytochrome oxidase maturation protein [Rhodothermales bacterium]|jgi:cbb3-type cytochrome oxidase maturation protein
MNVLLILVPLAILLAATAVGGFFWAVRNGQFEDTRTPGVRILLEDDLDAHEAKSRETPD